MKTLKIFLALFVLIGVSSAYAQIDVKEKIKEKSANRAETRVDEGIDNGIDKLEDGVGKLFKKKKGNKAEVENQNDEETENDTVNTVKKDDPDGKASSSFQSYSKYDFVPGDKVLYYEDFSQDAIGDFPALWTTNGGGEVKTVNIAPGQWFHMNKEGSVYCYTKTIDFPQNFIMEYDFIPDENFQSSFQLCFYEELEKEDLTDDLYPGKMGLQIYMDEYGWGSKGYMDDANSKWLEASSTANPAEKEKINHVIIWVQGTRLRVYHKGAKVLDSPTNIYKGTKFNKIRFSGWSSECKPYVSNLKVTTAAPDTRSKLITEGKLVSYGIYFDVNKDVVKSESYGTLSDIAKTLKENPSVKIKIIGHTDSDGDDAQNLDLSKRRAASVKNVLSNEFGIENSRIQTDGKGESEPISPNATTEGKAQNRRVEFIKI